MRCFVWLGGLSSIALLVACSHMPDTGGCSPPMRSCTTMSGSVCVNTTADVSNCGGCGVHCAPGQGCYMGMCRGDGGMPTDMGSFPDLGPHDAGMCMPTCSAAQNCCGTTCVPRYFSGGAGMDGTMDPSFMNCGACGTACDPLTANRCAMGTAGITCQCGGSSACGSGQRCMNVGGAYTCGVDCAGMGPCPTGNTCCGTGTAQMCLDLMTDDMNCGMCDHPCGTGEGCSGGRCVALCGGVACRAATPMDLGEICCAGSCVANDATNCGMCGVACDTTSGEACISGITFPAGAMGICCGMPPPIPGFPAICSFVPPTDAGTPDAGDDAGAPDADVDAAAGDAMMPPGDAATD